MISSSYLSLLWSPKKATSPFTYTINYLDLYRTLSETSWKKTYSPLNAISESYQVAISDVGKLKSALESFQTSARDLTDSGLDLLTANSSAAEVLNVTSGTGLVAGSHTVVVTALAQGQSLTSASHSSATDSIGSGTITTVNIEFGTTVGSTFTPTAGQTINSITIDGSNNSLQGIASAVNAANIGVSASVIFDGTAHTLVLTSPEGAENSMRITVTGDTALQGLLATDPAGAMNLTQTIAAQNAALTIDGVAVSSPTNSITGAIVGTTLNLNATGSSTVVVGPDATAIESNITNFLSAYNALQSSLNTLGGGRQNANLLPNIRNKISTTIGSTPYGLTHTPYNSLAQLGIRTHSDRSLSVDITQLQNAINTDAAAVAGLFSNNGNGIADKLVIQIGGFIDDHGTLASESAVLDQAASMINAATARLTIRATNNYSWLTKNLNTYQSIYSLLTI